MTIQSRYAESLMNAFGPPKLGLVRGEGTHVWDDHDKRYLDLFGGIAVNALGHAHPALVDAVATQLRTLGHVSNFFATEPQVALAERLLELLGAPGAGKVFFTNSGAEANEAAFKLSRLTGRSHLVATEGAFHGRTMGALALTAKAAYREPFEPLPGHVTFVPYGDAEALAAAVTKETAAVVIEPVQGEAGVVTPPQDYLARARRITRDAGALLWLDEVQSGIGRTGAWFAHQNPVLAEPMDGHADVVTLAKGLAGGIPVGACVAFGEAATMLEPGNHGTTFGGNPVAAAAALAVLDTIEKDGLLDHTNRVGRLLRGVLEQSEEVVDVEGTGLMLGAQLHESLGETAGADVVAAGQDAGFLLNATGPRRLRFVPPLVLSEADVQEFADAWPGILAAAAAHAEGKPS